MNFSKKRAMHNRISNEWLPTAKLMAEAPEAVKTAHKAAERAFEGIDRDNLEFLKALRRP
jgi:hypothetical protein